MINIVDGQGTVIKVVEEGKAYPCNGVDEIYLNLEQGKPLYVAVTEATGQVRIGNTPITPVYVENPDISPCGTPPFETVLATREQRHWMMHQLISAENWTAEEIAPIDEQAEIHLYDNGYEYSKGIDRVNGDHVSICVGLHPQGLLVTVSTRVIEDDFPEPYRVDREQVSLSVNEMRILRELLNSPTVSAFLDEDHQDQQ